MCGRPWAHTDAASGRFDRAVRQLHHTCSVRVAIKLCSMVDLGQTDRVTTPTNALDSAAAAGLDRATPHASPR